MVQPGVSTIGLHIVDILGRPVTEIPKGQGIAFLDEIRMTPAGTCAATALNLARLGHRTVTFGSVGADELGFWLRERLQRFGVDTTHLSSSDAMPTSATMLPIRPNGERPALHVRGANTLITEASIDWNAIASTSHLHIGGTSLLPGIDGEPTGRILKEAKRLGLTTSLDLIFDPSQDYEALLGPCYEWLDYFLPNDEDALSISGAKSELDAAHYFISRGVKNVAITLGAKGALFAGKAVDAFTIGAPNVQVIDTTGCGDAFSAGLISGVISGLLPQEAVRRGIACGSLTATGLGSDAGITTLEALERFCHEQVPAEQGNPQQ